jgi:hypothetical protein
MPITINGSGTVTGITAGGLPDAIITQPELATGVAGTGPAFSVYISANFSTTSNVGTKIPFNTENFDTASAFDSTTNYRFTPLVAGYYQINLTVQQGFAAAIGITNASIYKNGVEYTQGTRIINSATAGQSGINSVVVYLNGSTDYIEFYGLQNSGSTQSSTFISGTSTQASGVLVRAA